MQTQCPKCKTRYRVTQEQLETAHGQVRCGHCQHVFNAAGAVFTQVEEEPDLDDIPLENQFKYDPNIPIEDHDLTRVRPGPDTVPFSLEDELHEELQTDQGGVNGLLRTLVWSLMFLLATAALGVQYLYKNRSDLVYNPRMHTITSRLCEVAGCEIPARRAPERIELIGRDVRRHEEYQNALLVNLTLNNQAGFAQPYPTIQVSFHDTNGRELAKRFLSPDQYLGVHPQQIPTIQAEGTAVVVLELMDPGERAISYQFDFL